ncbi:Carboxylesterase family [Geosmithia morbida]|uniref:Carboxylesterase family n=1 Tax=Geosmithia morbida TaxID=1094350 RepID=A0A9P4YSE9_9HYPO|nr:Carboxylesterase family [Geosmithia morbida]KAF4120868.1 Carboxylesterase family [Geosmithia morbida]
MSDNSPSTDLKTWQPIHPSIRDKLDPEYVAFHDKYMQYVQPDETKTWDGSARTNPSLPPGGSPAVDVGDIRDVSLDKFQVRAYIPAGSPDERGWPVLIWFHGGGWAIGGLEDGKDFCSWVCRESMAVVISVDYRLAPENPFPAAVIDSLESVNWVISQPPELGSVDTSRISIGGTSAGANLAITAAIVAANSGVILPSLGKVQGSVVIEHPIVSLLLIVPVVDNTATAAGVWEPNAPTAPWLTPKRMEWYRKLYFTNPEVVNNWDASPNLAPDLLLRNLPRTWIAYSDQDILAPEAVAFGNQIESLGVDVTMTELKGCTHSILALNGRIAKGKELIEDAARFLYEVFWP